MYRAVVASVLSLFLLFMQQEGARHSVEHLGAKLAHSQHAVLEQPTGACLECELLAGGTGSVPAAQSTPLVDAPTWLAVAAPAARAAIAAPSYYRSRAPPLVLQHA